MDYSPGAVDFTNVLGNDALGDCTCAGIGHIIEAVTAASGRPVSITTQQVIDLYSASCGYVPGRPETDQGGDEFAVLNYVTEKGIDGKGLHKFDASVLVDATNKAELRAALYLFGNLYFGEELPASYVSPFPSDGGTWDVAGDAVDTNGHAFIGFASDCRGIHVNTWGRRVLHTYEAIAKYAAPAVNGELHTVLTCDWFNAAAKAPNGFAYQDLLSDLQAIGGKTAAPPILSPPAPIVTRPALVDVIAALTPLWSP